MHVIGLTGGIGAGKSTVAEALVARGAVIVDADRIARQVVEPDGPAYAPLIARFGDGIVGPDGQLDRPALAALAFASAEAVEDLNNITHPAIWAIVQEHLDSYAGTGKFVVLDLPLLREETRYQWPFEAIIVVDTPIDVAVERLIRFRGLAEADARARIAAQITRQQRLALADVVIDNSGDPAQLEAEIERAWAFVQARCAEVPRG